VANNIKYEVWYGEWSLATDTCAHWLGGFNDGNTKPVQQCQWVDCPKTYLDTTKFPNATVDASIGFNGPHGYGINGDATDFLIQSGKCSTDSAHFSEADVAAIAKCALDSFDKYVNVQFMWTAHNEIESRWSFKQAYEKGWINHSGSETEQFLV
jgi:hypothetical protein